MLQRFRQRPWSGAVAASVLYWGFGHLCLLPYYLAPATFTPRVVGWGAVLVAPPTVGVLTWLYLAWLGERWGWRTAWPLALALLGLHIPADYLFLSLALPELLPVLWQFGPFLYPSFALVPILVAAVVSRRRRSSRTENADPGQ